MEDSGTLSLEVKFGETNGDQQRRRQLSM